MTGDLALDDPGEAAFLSPREVRVGDGALERSGEILERWAVPEGDVLLICDAILPELGHTDRAVAALERRGYRVEVFADVVGEPELATAEAVTERVRARDHVAVVGMGGGSAMDLAKVAAAMATNDGDPLDLVGADTVTTAPLPLLLVPTTAGTGSEATRIAMIYHQGEKAIVNDGALVPLAAVLDPTLVTSLPPPVTASTGMDALSHAIESSLSTNASVLSMAVGAEAIELLSAWLPTAYHEGSPPSRRATLYGAYLAGVALNAGVVLGHSIAYTIANRTGLPHGVTAAMALPYCVAYNAAAARETTAQLAARVAGSGPGAAGLCTRLAELNQELGVPTSLADAGIPTTEVPAMARECLERYPRPNNPATFELDRLETLYGHLWEGTVADVVAALA